MSDVADSLAVGPGPIVAPIRTVAVGEALVRGVSGISGIAASILGLSAPVPVVSGYSWDSADEAILAVPNGAAVAVTLPSSTQLTLWPAGRLRAVISAPVTAHGVNLVSPASVNVNFTAGGTGMTPIPGTNAGLTAAVLGRMTFILRLNATTFVVLS